MLSAVFASSPVVPDLFGQSVGNDRKALFRLFTLCFQDFFGCRKFRFYLIPSRQSARRMKRLTAAGSVSQQRDCRRHWREAVETMRPEGRMTAVITAAMSVAAQCSVIRWLPSPARVKRSWGGAGAVSAGVWPVLLVAWGFSEFSVRAGSGGVALPFSRSAGSGAGVSPASEAVADASVADGAFVVAAVGVDRLRRGQCSAAGAGHCALLLSPLVLLRPLVLPTLPVSLLLSLPSCLPIAGASPRSPVRCGECGGGYGVLRSGTAPRRPVAGPDFRTEGGRCRNLRRCRGRFRFARVCCAFGRLPPLRNFRCIGRSESVLRCRVRCAAGAACCGPSCGSGLRVLRRASFLPARKTDGSKAASRAGICGFAAENRAAGQFGGRGVGPAFEVVDRDLRHDGRDGCAYGVFQRFVVGERRRARG